MSSYHARVAARIGVLTADGLLLPGGGLIALTGRENNPRALAEQYRLHQLWLFGAGPFGAAVTHWEQQGNEPAIVRPALDNAAPWRDAATPHELRAALQLFNDALGRPYGYSPARTGAVLADATMPRPRQPVTDWPEPATRPNTVSDPSMIRELSDAPPGQWLHCYDKNAMYLAACSSVELGLADLVHVCDAAPRFDSRAPGYWQLADAAPGTWLATPAVALVAEESEQYVTANGAYVWREHNRALRNWYERIRDARALLMEAAAIHTPGAALALKTLKLVYTMTIGWWSSRRGRDESSTQYRPDWRHMIMSQAHANMRRQIAKCDAAGTPPVAWVGVDTLCFLSDEPDWGDAYQVAAPPITLGQAPGMWKYKCTLPPATVDAIWSRSGRERVRALVREIQP